MNNIFKNHPKLLQSTYFIKSKQNSKLKKLRKIIYSNQFRKSEKLFWVEGEKLCNSYFQNVKVKKKLTIVFDEKFEESHILKILDKYKLVELELLCLKTSLFKEISQIDSSPGWGIISSQPYPDVSQSLSINDLIILDGIQDPGNLGNIIRLSAAIGIKNIWLTKGTSDPFSPKVIRAGGGGQFIISFSFFSDLNEILKRDEISQMQILATDLNTKSKNLFDKTLDLKKNCAWVFGSEGYGISNVSTKKNNLLRLKIPHIKEIESLNVASSVAICLFEMQRQRIR